VWLRTRGTDNVGIEAVRLPPDGLQLDYPDVTMGSRQSAAATAFLAFLRGARARAMLAGAGFRDERGKAAGPLAHDAITDSTVRAKVGAPSIDAVERVIESWTLSNEPSRLLAVLDVSGSMGTVVPGTGGATRLALTKQAALRGLGLYPKQTEIGLWTFSTDLTRVTDPIEAVWAALTEPDRTARWIGS
jgi:Ca-activated chloride channel family protein